MTTATCIYCGSLKFGAFVPCQKCERVPTRREDVIRSLALTDHHFTHNQLADFATQIQHGHEIQIDSELETRISAEIDDNTLETLAKSSDPTLREYYRNHERNIILIIMVAILMLIGWMIYRFVVG